MHTHVCDTNDNGTGTVTGNGGGGGGGYYISHNTRFLNTLHSGIIHVFNIRP